MNENTRWAFTIIALIMSIAALFVNTANRQENIKQVEQGQEQEEEFDIACFWCSTLVDGHCTDDTNWSRWCYSGFEWERPEDEF